MSCHFAGAWAIVTTVGALSACLGLLLPPALVGAPEWAYMLLLVRTPAYGFFVNRRRADLSDSHGGLDRGHD